MGYQPFGAFRGSQPLTNHFRELKADTIELSVELLLLDKAAILSNNFVSGTSGFKLEYDGSVELNDVTIRGTLEASLFRTASSGTRLEIDGSSNDTFISFYDGATLTALMGWEPTGYGADALTISTETNLDPIVLDADGSIQLLAEGDGGVSVLIAGDGDGAIPGKTLQILNQAKTTEHLAVMSNGQTRFSDGAVGTPSLSFGSDTDTGFWWLQSGFIAASTNGSLALYIDSAQHVRFSDGTAAAPSLTFFNDPDTGMFRYSTNIIALSAGNSTQMRTGNSSNPGIRVADGSEVTPGLTFYNDSSMGLYRVTTDTLGIVTTSTERGRITAAGGFLWAKTTAGYANPGFELGNDGRMYVTNDTSTYISIFRYNSIASGDQFIRFTSNTTTIGSIAANGTSAVQYNTTSDIRRKKKIKPILNALDTLMQLEPIGYEMKRGDGTKYQGFSAQHTVNLVPSAVTYSEDDDWWGMDLGQLVPTLVAAVQELTERLATLEAA